MTDGIVGNSPAIRTTIEMVHRVANSDATVLITGESGTGKELVARAVHNLSPHRDKPFIAVNCAAMPAPLLESELFGHVRGAFTDAKTSRSGLFVQAGSGTIFLDEIGEMPLEMQVKLLRVLQERRVRPVGGDEEIPIDARVVTATNRDLEHEVEERRFREDLFYRINVVAIPVPPLRDRAGDILVLAQHFIRRAALRSKKDVRGIGEHAARFLLGYDWPGNVRELENSMERAVALCKLDQITVDDLPAKLLEDHKSKLVISGEPSELITPGGDGAPLRPPGAQRRRRQQDARRADPRHRSPVGVSPPRGSEPAAAARRGCAAAGSADRRQLISPFARPYARATRARREARPRPGPRRAFRARDELFQIARAARSRSPRMRSAHSGARRRA